MGVFFEKINDLNIFENTNPYTYTNTYTRGNRIHMHGATQMHTSGAVQICVLVLTLLIGHMRKQIHAHGGAQKHTLEGIQFHTHRGTQIHTILSGLGGTLPHEGVPPPLHQIGSPNLRE